MSEKPAEEECSKPCDPDLGNECCAAYWQRMEDEGFWDRARHRWTDIGWKEIMRNL